MPVPPVEGQTVNAARDTLEKAGLKLGRVNPSNGTGVVFQQSLAPNRCVPIGTSVDIWIKDATPAPAATEEVPDLRGQSPLGAALALTMRGLHYGGSSKEQSNEVAPGRIFNQQPAAGTRVPKGATVVVTLAEAETKTLGPQETLRVKSNVNGPAIPKELVTFVATAQGSPHTIQYEFDFGDGHKSAPSDSPEARHSYTQDGNYTVTVTAILDGGVNQVTASTDVSVHDAPQGVTLDVSPRPVNEKQPVTFTASVYPPEPAPRRYTFQFGDKHEEVSETPSVTHAYQDNSVYHPFVTIQTAHGHKASSQPIALIVVPPPLSVWMIVVIGAGVALSGSALGVAGYKIWQRIVTQGISSNLRPGQVIIRLQTADGGVKEDDFQFHTVASGGVVRVEEQASVVRGVEVQR